MTDNFQGAALGIRETPGTARPDDRLKGILCLVAGIAVFSVQDLIIKLLSGDYPLYQMLTIRGLTALPVLFAFVLLEAGLDGFRSQHPWSLTGRGIIMFLAYLCYYLGLAALPIPTVVAIFFTAPLFITLLSIALLGERVSARRWLAVIGGFLGVVIMLRPGSEIFEWASLLPVGAALFYGLSQIIARRLGRSERASTLAFYGNVIFILGGLVLAAALGSGQYADESHLSLGFMLRGWTESTPIDLLLMMLCGVIAAVAIFLLTRAYVIAEANVVAPFEYTALIWGVLYGWVFWRDLPDVTAWAGIAIIVASGLYVLLRDRRQSG